MEHVDKRISTGIEKLDELLEGGIPKNKVVLIKGVAGTGKTTFGLQFLLEGAKNKETTIYLTLEQSTNDIIDDSKRLLPDLQKYVEEGKIIFIDTSLQKEALNTPDIKTLFDQKKQTKTTTKEEKFNQTIQTLLQEINQKKATRLVIDSVNALGRKNRLIQKEQNKPYDTDDHYDIVYNIIQRCRQLGVTTYLLAELNTTQHTESAESYIADGEILLEINQSLDMRLLTILKMRKTRHTSKAKSFKFEEKKGITIKDEKGGY